MKKLLMLLVCLIGTYSIYAQQLKKGEYYYDTDPGVGNGTSFTFTQADSINLPLSASTGVLPVGFHKIYVRIQGTDNKWSLSYENLFYVYDVTPPAPSPIAAKVAAMEYFFDDIDYGPGQCAYLNPFTPLDSVLVNGSVIAEDPLFLTPLSVGAHKVNIRAKDLAGKWSLTKTVAFTVCDQAATASFTQTVSGTTVTFTNTSTNSFGSQWIFGDGTTSTQTSPVHTYNNGGVLNVGLISYSGCGNDTTWNLVTLNCASPVTNFTSSATNLTVGFTNTSTFGSSYLWNFGDGRTSTDASPSHVFQSTGTYSVCLTTTNGCGTSTQCKPVTVTCTAPVASYNVNISGYTATLTNTSTNVYNFIWNFGDATTNNVDFNPVKQYTAPGTYTLKLTVNNGCGANIYQQPITIACAAPTASFNTYNDGLGIEIENNSLNGTTWSWNFGDGTTSTFKNPPIHNFPTTGTYTITLIATNNCGADTITQVVNVCTPPVANYSPSLAGTSVSFTNLSSNATTYLWNFGNGLITNLASPTHVFANPGTFNICLTASNQCGTSQHCSSLNLLCNTLPTPEICMVTVDDPGDNNIIYWDKTNYGMVDTFLVYREITNGNYSIIGKVPYNSLSQFVDTVRTLYFPNTGNPRQSAYKYRLGMKDTCGNLSTLSLYHKTMFLQDNTGNFIWNHYEIEGQSIPIPQLLNYLFLRDNDLDGIYETPIASTTSNSFTDLAYATYQNTADWRIHTDWSISCTPTLRLLNGDKDNEIQTALVKSKSNVRNNRAIGIKSDINNLTSKIKVYPNPTTDILNVEFLIQNEKEATITMENMLGQIVYTMQTNKPINSINTTNLMKGVYFVKVNTGKGVVVEKLIVE